MQETTIQPVGDETQTPVAAPVEHGWFRRKKKQKPAKQIVAPVLQSTGTTTSFYERAIEWTHRADKVINLVLGYLLAIASVLGFMDVLSNGQVLNTVPYLFYVWLGIMGLGVDFQILLVIGRAPDLLHMPVSGWQKSLIGGFNVVFLVFLAVMSVMISAIFTQHRDVQTVILLDPLTHHLVTQGSTISDAMNELGINSIVFVYGRAALATLLLVLMAVDRTTERWRMQLSAATLQGARQQNTPAPEITPVQPATPTLQVGDIDKMLQAITAMNHANLQAMQEMSQQSFARATQVSVQLIEQTMHRLTADISLATTPNSERIAQVKQDTQASEDTTTTGEIEVVALPGTPSQGIQNLEDGAFKDRIEALMLQEPNLKDREIADRVGCSLRTANRWKNRARVPESA